MKKVIILGSFCFLIMLFRIAYAHPPSDIAITYDPATKILQAVIVHRVNNPKMHYIKRVDIGLNGGEVTTLRFMKQDNNNTQTISYEIPNVKTGDTLSVEAYCSISGILEREIKVEEKPLLNK